MPTMKNRGEGRNDRPMTLMNAMGLPGKKAHGDVHDSKDYLFKNVDKTGNKKASGKGVKIEGKTDVKTRINLPHAKTSGKRSRTQKNMKAK